MEGKDHGDLPRIYLSTYLTREEWKVVYGYWWVSMNLPAYRAAELGEEERWRLLGSMGAGMRWAIRQLCLRHGARFHAVAVDSEGDIRTTRPDPICQANLLYVARLKEGKGPNMLHLLNDAVAYMRSQEWDIDLDPFMEALAKVRADVEQAKADTDPEWEAQAVKTLEEGMKLAGYTKGRLRDRGHGGGRYEN